MRTALALWLMTVWLSAQPLSPHDPGIMTSGSSLRRGLVGYWRLEEASGTRYDCSNNGYNLLSSNSVGQVSGKVGFASDFVKASTQYLTSATNAVLLNSSSLWTLCCWIRMSFVSTTEIVVGRDDASLGREYCIYWNGAGGFGGVIGNGGNSITAIAGPTVTGTNWNFVVLIRSNSIAYMSANNQSLVPTSISVTPGTSSSTKFSIGSGTGGALNAGATVDEVGAWKRQLTSSELTYIYNSGLGTHFPWAHP